MLKRLTKLFMCFCILFASCVTMIGCGSDDASNTKEWTNTTINSENHSTYFDLSSYLYYDCANSDYYFDNMPCVDNCSTFGSITDNYVIKDRTSEDFFKKSSKYFFGEPQAVENKRWKIIEFSAKTDLRIKNIEFDITKNEDIIIDTYNVSFIVNNKIYTPSSSEHQGLHSKFTFNGFWFENYEDIATNSYLLLPKATKITILFNDTQLIKETYSKTQSEQNGITSEKYSTDEERAYASEQSSKCFNIGNFSFNCDILK